MSSPLLFYLSREDGTVTGPHPAGFLRKGLETGELSLDQQVCMDGTQDWLPISEFSMELGMQQPQRRQWTPQAVAAYSQAPSQPRGNSPLRIFWGAFFLLSGVSQASVSLIFFGPETMPICIISAILAVLWFVIGTKLMSAPAAK